MDPSSRLRSLPLSGVLGLLCALAVGSPVTLRADTLLRMSGDAREPITQGRNWFYTPANGSFYPYTDGSGVGIWFENPEISWELGFEPPYARPMAPGAYSNAYTAGLKALNNAGIGVSGDGRMCNRSRGTFWVRQAKFGPANALVAFWATFEQHCDDGTRIARGEIRFNADTALYVTTPADLWLRPGQSVHFDLSATDTRGHAVALGATGLPAGAGFVDHGDGTGTFDWPAGSPDTATVLLDFRATSTDGKTAVAVTVVHVHGDNRVTMGSEAGDFVGRGLEYSFDESNSTMEFQANPDHGVSLHVTSTDMHFWYLQFSASGGEPLSPGNYLGASQYPVYGQSTPGLSVHGNGRGCNGITGQFVVYDVGYGSELQANRFWATFEQHCGGGPAAFRGEIRIGGDAPVATELATVRAEARVGVNYLEWYAADAAGITAVVQRRSELTGWSALADIAADGAGRLFFEDVGIPAGSRLAYCLAYPRDGSTAFTAETWLTSPPEAVFALEGARPNPSTSDFEVSFALPDARPASLEMVDLTGRRVLQRDVGALGAGRHVIRLDQSTRLAPGTYWLRLRQGNQVRVRSAILVR